jgi:hypothetical protein
MLEGFPKMNHLQFGNEPKNLHFAFFASLWFFEMGAHKSLPSSLFLREESFSEGLP